MYMLYFIILLHAGVGITDSICLHSFKKENLLLLAVIPGPKKPNHLYSFLQPLLSELMILQDSGMVVHTPDGEFKSKVHLLATGGDIPAIGELIGNSHTGAYGCRICLVKGQRVGKGGMFFPPTKKAPYTRQVSSFITGDAVRFFFRN